MDERKYRLELEKTKEREKTRREVINAVFWLCFWLIAIGGCTAVEVL